ncbi:MAG: redoxin domain-containing protein [Deltaproteobacteria bacterium]|nr:redoxin domain-containing protein [Deltaproteobacteria bacterium]
MIRLDLYTKDDCGLCEEMKAVIEEVGREIPLRLVEHDITADPELFERYRLEIPVLHVDGHRAFKYRLDAPALRARLKRAGGARTMDTVKLQPLITPRDRLVILLVGLVLALAPVGESMARWLLGPVQPIPVELNGLHMDQLASEFTLKDLTGTPVSLTDYRGKTVFVNFWATWCPPCVEELPSILRLHQALEQSGFVVLAISEDDSVGDVRKFFSGNLPPFPVLMDEGQKVTRAWGTVKFPETYVVDPDGRVVAKFIGPRDWASPASVDYFRTLVGG